MGLDRQHEPHGGAMADSIFDVQFIGEGGDAVRVDNGAIWLCSFFLQQAWRVSLTL